MKREKELKFIRFGGLSSVKQKGYSKDQRSFHSPPCRRGIYAFVFPYVEKFLLSGAMSQIGQKHAKFQYKKDLKGNKKLLDIHSTDWSHEKDGEFYSIELKKGKVFSYTGDIWHHLEHQLKPIQIIEKRGSWVKSTYSDFKYAFNKEIYQINFEKKKNGYGSTKDHLEVFIEKVK